MEAVIIAVVGTVIALVANAKNPDGLALGRNYFGFAQPPGGESMTRTGVVATGPSSTQAADNGVEELKKTLINNGIGPIEHAEVAGMFQNPMYQQGLYLFIDARDADHYAAGHIPGAYHIDAFMKDEVAKKALLDEMIQLAQSAEKVVVYCNGGHCDDSIGTAVDLRNSGLDPTKLFVYLGGIHEWHKAGLPIEGGERNSGTSGEITE